MTAALSAVLPLSLAARADGGELDRARLLLDSLAWHSDGRFWDTIWVVVPPGDVDETRRALLDRWELPVRIADERDWVPELAGFRDVEGWYKQQVLKLAASHFVEGFYLTLDADVVCRRPLGAVGLLRGGRALLQRANRRRHAAWWRSSACLLGVPPDLGSPGMGVTPAILAARPTRQLLRRLGAGRRSWADRLLRPLRKRSLRRLLPGYHRRHSWSEYTLYYLYLAHFDQFEQWHFTSSDDRGEAQRFYSRASVWQNTVAPVESFAARIADPDDTSPFIIFQSNAEIDPAAVRRAFAVAREGDP